DGVLDETGLKDILTVIESFIFRRSICNIPSNALNKLFSSLEKDIRKHEDFKEQYCEIFKYVLLEKQSNSRYPGNDEFNQALFSRDLYNIQSKTKVYLLEKLENSDNKEVIDLTKLLNDGTLTIEHIMPQTLTPIWERELGEHFEEVHLTYLHTLGNLTLTAYNSEYQNYPFIKKRDMNHGFRESKIKLNNFVSQCDNWGEHQIQERAKLLIELALSCWKSPISRFVPKKNEGLTYSIDDEQSFMYSQIVSYEYMGKEFIVSSWADFYKQIVQNLYDKDSTVINSILLDQLFATELKTMLSSIENKLRSPYKVAENVFLELNLNTNTKLILLRKLISYYNEEDLNIRFTIRDDFGLDDTETLDDLEQENLGRGITAEIWVELLVNPKIFKKENLDLVETLNSATEHKMPTKKLAAILNTKSSTLNLQVMHLGKRVIDETKILDQFRADGSRRFWNIFFIIEIVHETITWQLRPEIVLAWNECRSS
ncbi:MAG: HNH endonuclease family protein, partial [Erysipelotrichaceae bacterium]